MAEIHYGSVFDAVTLALHAAFPPPVQIHGGAVEQGLRPGDLTVVLPNVSQDRRLGLRWRRGVTVDVIYYPRPGERQDYRVADRLASALEVVTTPAGDQIRGREFRCSWVDGVLHALVEYPHYVYQERGETPMEDLTEHVTVQQEGGTHA